MPLKFQYDVFEDIPAHLREHYVSADGKFRLQLDDEHPDTARIKEFRTSAIEARKERDAQAALLKKFEGLDPVAAREALDKVAAGETADVVALKEELAKAHSAGIAAQQQADRAVFTTQISNEFLRMGGQPNAVAFMVSEAERNGFVVKEGALTNEKFSTIAPGQKLTVNEWLTGQLSTNRFAFKPSSGGGAHPLSGGSGPATNVLRNPTPQQLGEHAREIRDGRLKVSHDE